MGVPAARVARLTGVTVPVLRSLVMYAVLPSGVIAIPRPPGPFPILMGRPARCVAVLTGVSVHVDVAPDRALDAFDHPYAYLAQPKSALPPASIESTPAPIRDRRE